MKKVLAIVLALVMVLSFAACGKGKPLADETHEAWVAHGQYLLADGTENGWGGKSTEVYEKSALKAITVEDVKKIDKGLYETLKGKDVKYLYTTDLIFGTVDAGWSAKFVKDGEVGKANGSYAFKIAQCTAEVDGSNKVYSEDVWISDPKVSYVESLTPDTVFYPVWQEEPDENGLSWADNPVVTGGAGLYTVVVAQYTNASAPGAPGYGVGLVLKEAKEGIPYVFGFVPADHTYGIVGGFAASDWGNAGDIPMESAGENVWQGEVELKAGEEFKVRADKAWNDSWGDGEANLKAEADGTYVVTITFTADGAVVEAKLK